MSSRPLSGDVGYGKVSFRSTARPVITSNTPRSTSTLARKSLPEDIAKVYKVDTTKDKLDDIALESTHTIEIDEFVPKVDIDGYFLIRPYYLVLGRQRHRPDGMRSSGV